MLPVDLNALIRTARRMLIVGLEGHYADSAAVKNSMGRPHTASGEGVFGVPGRFSRWPRLDR